MLFTPCGGQFRKVIQLILRYRSKIKTVRKIQCIVSCKKAIFGCYPTRGRQKVTLRTPRSGIPPTKKKPPIAEELEKLREKPARSSNREPLSRLERLAILDGLKDGEGPTRIAGLWGISKRTVREFKSKLYFTIPSLRRANA